MIRICILGNTDGSLDEGMNKLTRYIYEELKKQEEVLFENPRHLFRIKFWKKLISFKPQIVHYIPGPTIRSFIVLKAIKIMFRNARTVSSATRPYFSKYSKLFIRYFKPDLIITQSMKFESLFREKNCKVKFIPNGVDCKKFRQTGEQEKLNIRKIIGLPLKKKIVLHVGHIKNNRNLDVFKEIQKIENVQVVIVGSITESTDERLKINLQKAGIKVYHKLYDDISQFYKMSDLYIFPVRDSGNKLPDSYNQVGAIDLPLSVLEAMACNLPVIATTFGALTRIFDAGNGLLFCDTKVEILEAINNALANKNSNTRQKVMPYHWGRVIDQLGRIYQDTITGEPIEAGF